MAGSINVNQNNNKVILKDQNPNITITDNVHEKVVNVTPVTTKIVEVLTPGPKGGFTGQFTGSANFSGSLNIDGNISASGNVTASSYTGSFVGDGAGLTNVTVPAGNLPSGLLSSSIQIASDISGAFNLVSSSLASEVSSLIDATSSYALVSQVSGAFATVSSSLASEVSSLIDATSSYALSTQISGAFNLVSSSLASEVSSLIDATSSYALSTQISGAFTTVSSSLASEISSLIDATSSYALSSQVSGAFTTVSSSLASEVSSLIDATSSYALSSQISGSWQGFITSSGILSSSAQISGSWQGFITSSGILSSSAFSSPSQGTVRAIINGTTTDVDTGLQTGDGVEFLNITASTITASSIKANTMEVIHLTSSFITASTVVTTGSNVFGDEASDTHTFIGDIIAKNNITGSGYISTDTNITASGNISASGNITADQIKAASFRALDSSLIAYMPTSTIIVGNDSDPIKIDGSGLDISTGAITTDDTFTSTNYISVTNITASGNISASSTGSFGSLFLESGVIDINSGNIYTFKPSSGAGTLDFEVGGSPQKITAKDRLKIESGDSAIELTGNITSSGNIEAISYISASEFRTTGHITASGNISASGNVFGNIFKSNDISVLYNPGGANQTTLNSVGNGLLVQGTKIKLNAPVTASIISSSGNFIANQITASGNITATGTGSFGRLEATSNIALQVTNSQQIVFENSSGTEFANIQMNSADNMLFQNLRSNKDLIMRAGNSGNEGHIIIQPGGDQSTNIAKFGKTADLDLLGNLTASGNISASGTLYASAGDFGDGNITNVGIIDVDQVRADAASTTIIGLGSTVITNAIGGTNITEVGSYGTKLGTAASHHVTASGNISSSGTIVAKKLKALGSEIVLENGHITASGNISASGNILGQNYFIEGKSLASYTTNTNRITVGFNQGGTKIRGEEIFLGEATNDLSQVTVFGNITASGTGAGNISASGIMYMGTPGGGQTHEFYGRIRVIGSDVTIGEGNITASGNVSASGTMTMVTGSMNHLITDGSTIEFRNAGTKAKEGTLKFDTSNGLSINDASGNKTKLKIGDLGVGDGSNSVRLSNGHITASGIISASGTGIHAIGGDLRVGDTANPSYVRAQSYKTNDITALQYSAGVLLGSTTGTYTTIQGTTTGGIRLQGHVTASNNISASGDIFSSTYYVDENKQVANFHPSTNALRIGATGFGIFMMNNVTASQEGGNISASGNVYGAELHTAKLVNIADTDTSIDFAANQITLKAGGSSQLVQTNNITTIHTKVQINDPLNVVGHVTASGNISASSNIDANAYSIKSTNVIERNTNDIVLAGASDFTSIQIGKQNQLKPLTLEGNVTASGNISSSGIVYADNVTVGTRLYFSGYGGSNTFVSETTNGDLVINNGGLATATNITASGNISSSATVEALTGSFQILKGDTTQNTQLFVNGAITASNNISSSGVIIGKNLNTEFIPIVPQDFNMDNVQNTRDYAGYIADNSGGEVGVKTAGFSIYATKMIPKGFTATSASIYGSDVTNTLVWSSGSIITSANAVISTDVVEAVSGTGSAYSSGVVGDGLTYVSVRWTPGTGDKAYGGKIYIQQS